MASVQELVNAFIAATGAPPARVRGVARELINQGLLPRSFGKRLAAIDRTHVALLVFAYYATEADTVSAAARAADRLRSGRAGVSLGEVADLIASGEAGLCVNATLMSATAWEAPIHPDGYPYPQRLTVIPAGVLRALGHLALVEVMPC
jgi:hypothetical protein